MFRNEAQQVKACRALLAGVHLERLWDDQGPTDEAVAILEKRGGPLSHGEALMVSAAWAIWNGSGWASLAETISGPLDDQNLRRLGTLLIALGDSRGSAAIDAWIASWAG